MDLMTLPENNTLNNLLVSELETEVAYLSYQRNVLRVKLKEGILMDIQQMEELLKQAVELADFKKYFAVVDTRANSNSSSDVRDFYAESEYGKYRYADAFIVDSLAMRLLVNFYISFNKPTVPTKMFTDEETAMAWINSLRTIAATNRN